MGDKGKKDKEKNQKHKPKNSNKSQKRILISNPKEPPDR